MKQILLIEKRKKAKRLKERGWSIRRIARELCAGKDNVSRWVKMNDELIGEENRGWKQGKYRRYSKKQEERVVDIRRRLEREESYFYSAEVVKANYEKQYGEEISKSFVDTTLRKRGLVRYNKRDKKKGGSAYMNYPKNTIRRLGRSMMSMDFIGPKYIKGRNDRINFLSIKYVRPDKRGFVKKIRGQTTEEVIERLKDIWKKNPIPEVVKIDNDSAFGTNLSHEMNIGRLTIFLLNLGVSPLYISPRSPWNNGEVEGFNSVFSKKFWNRIDFRDEEDIEIKIEEFNLEYERYTNLIRDNPQIEEPRYIQDYEDRDLTNKKVSEMKQKKIYFLRKVQRKGKKGTDEETGVINILKKEIKIDKKYINLFTFCTISLDTMRLKVQIENEDLSISTIKDINFPINNVLGLL